MTEPMTLEQARDWLRENPPQYESSDPGVMAVIAALDAHLATMGEPVAEVQQCEPYLDGSPNPMKQLKWTLSNCEGDLPVGTKLYLAPPASGDWDKVREVVIDLRRDSALLARDLTSENDLLDLADKLTAALPESQP